MTNEEKQELYTEVNELLDIYNEFSPCQPDGKSVIEAVKPCITEMIDYIMKDATEAASMKDWLDKTDFWTAPASTRFHGNFKGGLSLHTLMVIKQSLVFAHPMLVSPSTYLPLQSCTVFPVAVPFSSAARATSGLTMEPGV